jgi:hypothetical protein
LPPPSGAPSFLSAVTPPRRRRTMSSNHCRLSLRVALQMVFSQKTSPLTFQMADFATQKILKKTKKVYS